MANLLRCMISSLVLATTMLLATQRATAEPICEIITHGSTFDGKIVRFRAHYSTAPLDFPGTFSDKRCRGFIEDVTRGDSSDSSVRRFYSAQSALPQEFAVEVSGRFTWNKHWRPASALLGGVKPHPQGQIEITHVWKFRQRKSTR